MSAFGRAACDLRVSALPAFFGFRGEKPGVRMSPMESQYDSVALVYTPVPTSMELHKPHWLAAHRDQLPEGAGWERVARHQPAPASGPGRLRIPR